MMNPSDHNAKIAAVVVTFNRLEMLKDTISALKAQTFPADIIIINNGSTDGTGEFLSSVPEIHVITQENTGGAGGFHTGMKYAVEKGYDFVWVMDDDVIPSPDALSQLYADYVFLSNKEKVGFICSRVYSTTQEVANVPTVDSRVNSNGYADWSKYLEKGIVRVDSATFVSVFIPSSIIKEVGLPYKEFFIWGDDTEFTRRISAKFKAFLSGKSTIIHRRIGTFLDIKKSDDLNRVKMYRYAVRNNLFIIRKLYSKRALFRQLFNNVRLSAQLFLSGKFYKSRIVFTGTCQGLKFNPDIEYPNL